jgi:hypothetical protein
MLKWPILMKVDPCHFSGFRLTLLKAENGFKNENAGN